ncbi:MAG: hypothetical protein DRN71_05995 [Candidatus Nanohalarchaeota archaeon]|nr:MAG: hypothetical protein DRN71_05995 [Candidatus Nanohaloarchaeota archaeon]
MKETIISIGHAFIPNKNTLKIFAIFIILFFATLKNNPVESAVTYLTPLKLHHYHELLAPFTPDNHEFGTEKYCIEATGIIKCFTLYPKENIQNISSWYIISAISAGLIMRFTPGGKDL